MPLVGTIVNVKNPPGCYEEAFQLPGQVNAPAGVHSLGAKFDALLLAIADQQASHEARIAKMVHDHQQFITRSMARCPPMPVGATNPPHSPKSPKVTAPVLPQVSNAATELPELKEDIDDSMKHRKNEKVGVAAKHEFVPSMPEEEVNKLKGQFLRLVASCLKPGEKPPPPQDCFLSAENLLHLAKPFLDATENIGLEGAQTVIDVCMFHIKKHRKSFALTEGAVVNSCLSVKGFLVLMDDVLELSPLCTSLRNALQEEHVAYLVAGGGKNRVETFLDLVPPVVIILNSLQIGFSVDNVDPQLEIFWEILEYCFLLFYIFEAALKMVTWGVKTYFTGPDRYWNWFDFSCILTSLADAGVTNYIRFAEAAGEITIPGGLMLVKMLRLFRLARLIRTIRFKVFHELKLMVMGVVSGLRVLGWAIVLLFVLIYMLGLVMRQIIGSEFAELESMTAAMFTVFRCFTEGCSAYDGTPFQERLRMEYGEIVFTGYVLLYMLIQIGIFNLIMAIFIDNVVGSQQSRKQKELSDNTERIEFKMKAKIATLLLQDADLLKGLDKETRMALKDAENSKKGGSLRRLMSTLFKAPNVDISRQLFIKWLDEDKEFNDILNEASIETSAKAELFNILDADSGGTLDLQELFTGLMHLRGDVTKGDIIGMSMKLRYCISMVEQLIEHFGLSEEDDEDKEGEDADFERSASRASTED
eukprot:TRINITY_DN4642_c0_g1_i1.p1 TRINITY_DN4642_c0_g1~~TRINITY_DN4642_c0_g1_i1.p1  ORF type:complete len:702 (+),score=151.32 TRINITY_DN4642_c0_g1_i1:123-2228(+)